QLAWPQRSLARTAWNIEHIHRLTEAGEPAAQAPHDILPLGDGGAQMRRAWRQIAVVQVIGFDPAGDERPHERAERFGIVVDAFEQNGLADEGNSGVDEPRTSSLRGWRQLTRMIG